MSPKIIVAMDIHGTLVGHYNPAVPQPLVEVVQALDALGVHFVLHSDSGYATQLEVYAPQFQGVQLSQCWDNGAHAVLRLNGKQFQHVVSFRDASSEKYLAQMFQEIRLKIRTWCMERYITCVDGVADRDLTGNPHLRHPNGLLVLIDKHRESCCFFDVRRIQNNRILEAPQITGRVVKALLEVVKSSFEPFRKGAPPPRVYEYPEFGGYHAHDVGKGPFMQWLQMRYPEATLYHVGDGLNDIPAMQVDGVHGVCVGTHAEVRAAAKTVTRATGPAGTLEFLQKLLTSLGGDADVAAK